ncbi:MAG TPA: hypothetical protein DHV48_03450 [Prolixibacteraceae bacterium]|nr:hypothetical protein [Prolixibacteraceae bacterium]
MALKLTPEFLNRPIYTLTVREYMELNKLSEKEEDTREKENDGYEIKGIHALAEFLKVSPTTAQKLKNSGKIPFSQFGKIVRFDSKKVLDALEKIESL